jgi:hypothetical protein
MTPLVCRQGTQMSTEMTSSQILGANLHHGARPSKECVCEQYNIIYIYINLNKYVKIHYV